MKTVPPTGSPVRIGFSRMPKPNTIARKVSDPITRAPISWMMLLAADAQMFEPDGHGEAGRDLQSEFAELRRRPVDIAVIHQVADFEKRAVVP